jgi:hypothetical protein
MTPESVYFVEWSVDGRTWERRDARPYDDRRKCESMKDDLERILSDGRYRVVEYRRIETQEEGR